MSLVLLVHVLARLVCAVVKEKTTKTTTTTTVERISSCDLLQETGLRFQNRSVHFCGHGQERLNCRFQLFGQHIRSAFAAQSFIAVKEKKRGKKEEKKEKELDIMLEASVKRCGDLEEHLLRGFLKGRNNNFREGLGELVRDFFRDLRREILRYLCGEALGKIFLR
jgi:hypothetical protein